LYSALNSISQVFKRISAEKEAQFRYLEMLVEHLRVGILDLDENGKVHLTNQAFRNLLRKDVIFSLKSLEHFDTSLVNALKDIGSGETRLVKVRVHNEILQLSIHASEFSVEGKYHKLISMQNIRSELDAREMEAWQKLIRVLTHEIMNSVSPVISLSETLHDRVTQHREPLQRHPDLFHSLDKGLEAIKVRSEGLHAFTQSYRQLASTPKVSLQDISVHALVQRVSLLMEPEMRQKSIRFEVTGDDGEITADPHLIEQVLINLLQNAIEAVSGKNDAFIHLRTSRSDQGHVCIHVTDNGKGMDAATAEKIFIPFFTTRKNGSGIGLAITKQILQLHHADLQFTTEEGRGSEFIIAF
jgi:two-component system nitrogen regulation sensor histidine kinase NtrY